MSAKTVEMARSNRKMAAQRANQARSGQPRRPHDLGAPNLHGETRVHRRFFNGLLEFEINVIAKLPQAAPR